jgi:hypothetical protein
MSVALVQLAAQRALELRMPIGPLDSTEMPTDASQHAMINALRSAELDMLVTLMYAPESTRASVHVCGDWNISQLTGHLADWDTYYLDCLAEIDGHANAKRHWPDDVDEKNALLIKMRTKASFEQNWSEFRHNRLMLISQLERIHPERFLQHVSGKNYITAYHLAWSALEHYLEHAAHARRHMGLALPAPLLAFAGPYTDSGPASA